MQKATMGFLPRDELLNHKIVKWVKRRDLRYYSLSSALSPKKDIFQDFWTSFVQWIPIHLHLSTNQPANPKALFGLLLSVDYYACFFARTIVWWSETTAHSRLSHFGMFQKWQEEALMKRAWDDWSGRALRKWRAAIIPHLPHKSRRDT